MLLGPAQLVREGPTQPFAWDRSEELTGIRTLDRDPALMENSEVHDEVGVARVAVTIDDGVRLP